jgi:peptidoglycan/xylan/chitin deacetylase (PgdA/CDA1 family)
MSRPLRSAVKATLGRVAVLPGLERRTRGSLARTLNVAYAHYVGPPRPHLEAFYYGTDAAWLDATLGSLAKRFAFASLDEVLDGTARGSRPPLAVTFDDGFDMSTGDVPRILERHGVRATVFAITDCVGNRQLMWRNKLSAVVALSPPGVAERAYAELAAEHGLEPGDVLEASRGWPASGKDALADELWARCGLPPLDAYLAAERPYFTWDGLRAWLAAGHGVGLHTASHPRCDRLTDEEVRQEIVEPAARLREALGLDRVALSYPFGLRLPADTERRLVEDGTIASAFGIRGFSPRATPRHRLERATLEQHMEWELFGRPLTRSFREVGSRGTGT